MEKLLLVPDSSSYSATPKSTVLSVELDGGAARYRQDHLSANTRVSCQWVMTEAEYQYLQLFYRITTGGGANAFYADLLLDSSTLTQYEVHIVPGTYRLVSATGLVFTVSAELDVKQSNHDAAYDATILGAWPIYGEDFDMVLFAFEDFVTNLSPA